MHCGIGEKLACVDGSVFNVKEATKFLVGWLKG